MQNIIFQMLQKKFFVMYLPKHNVCNLRVCKAKQNLHCTEHISYYDERINENKIVVFENSLGSFVFANMYTFEFFQSLQKKHKDVVSYVFCADGNFGYFKILENGKIIRKIASFGEIDGIRSYPETRGISCSFEKERGKIYKIDETAGLLVNMLKDFTQTEVLELMDYYVGFNRIMEANIDSVYMIELENR